MKRHIRLLGLLSLFCLFGLFSISAQPAIDWTVDMSSSKIPTGATVADIDTLTSPISTRFNITLDATTYDNATASTAFNAIGAASETYILNTWLGAQALDTSAMATVVVVIKNINREFDTYEYPDPLLQYLVAEDIYRVTGIVRYTLD